MVTLLKKQIIKRTILCIFSLLLILSLVACSDGKNKKAFEASKEAYDNINTAYELTSDFGSDIYDAWYTAIYESDELIDGGCEYLAKSLNLSEDELMDGAVYTLLQVEGKELSECSEDDIENLKAAADVILEKINDNQNLSLFSWCLFMVENAYMVNEKVNEIQAYLDAAKAQMKDLSENYSDYEHYPALKGYYTTTSSFFDFCQNSTGSFEQAKTTIEKYKTDARDYKADLDYIFED